MSIFPNSRVRIKGKHPKNALRENKMKFANIPEMWVFIKVTLPVQLSHLLLNSLLEERARITPKTTNF